jgi:hypothetical protein
MFHKNVENRQRVYWNVQMNTDERKSEIIYLVVKGKHRIRRKMEVFIIQTPKIRKIFFF